MSTAHAHKGPHVMPLSIYLGVGGTLLVMTWVTYFVASIDLGGGWNLAVALSIAFFKGSLVCLFFMHDIWAYIAGACQPYRKKALRVFRDDFKIGADDVVFHPYWDNHKFMTGDTVLPDGVEVSFYHRTKKNTSIWGVFNTTKQPQRVKVGVALRQLALTGAAIIVSDPFGDREVVMADNGVVELEVPGRRIAYFQIALK